MDFGRSFVFLLLGFIQFHNHFDLEELQFRVWSFRAWGLACRVWGAGSRFRKEDVLGQVVRFRV